MKACRTHDHHSNTPHTTFRSAAGSGHLPYHSSAILQGPASSESPPAGEIDCFQAGLDMIGGGQATCQSIAGLPSPLGRST